ncbi:MAG: VWA domain-containing protein [Candidatus Cloacimonetes bacterium]|nr:VWA domain-containing protein [Candidatus Cloacimonadota bacterium]
MRFGNPYILFMLLLIPIFWIYIGMAKQKRKRMFESFAEPRFYNFFMQELSHFHLSLKNVLLVTALIFMIIAAARPRWGKEMQIVQKKGIDIVVAIDVSKSMDATDIKPNRIERAKDQISLFIDQLKGDRIAVVAFAGRSFVQCPLTDDYSATHMFLNLLDTETVPSYGTDIGGAIEQSINLFGEENKHKVIIVVSDGEDLEENAIDAAKEAAKQNAVIYSLGIGSPEGSTIPLTSANGNTEYAKNDKGDIVFTKLDISNLTKIANSANGRFFPITPQQSEIFEILRNINMIEKNKFDSKEYIRYKEQYKYFLLTALILLLTETLIITRRKKKLERIIHE